MWRRRRSDVSRVGLKIEDVGNSNLEPVRTLGPGHTKDFCGVLAKTRGNFLGFHDIRGRRQIFRTAFSSSFGVDEFRSGGISAAFHGM